MSTNDILKKEITVLKVLLILLLISSLLGRMEWGGGQSMFLFQAEYDVFTKIFTSPREVLHPFILLPMAGQLLILFPVFQSIPSKVLVYTGIAGMTLLMGMLLFIALLELNWYMLVCVMPFFIVSIMVIRKFRKLNYYTR